MTPFLVLATLFLTLLRALKADPTDGFSYVKLSEANFQVQKPYDVSVNQRYSYIGGEHRLWVYKTDKPYSQTSNTKPRTEIRITVSIFFPANITLVWIVYYLYLIYTH